MPSISDPNKDNRASWIAPQRRRVLYPMLPSILDEDSLSAVATFESEELAFARRQGSSRNQYLHALYLKAMATLGHSHFQPKDLPRQFRLRIAEQLGLEEDLPLILAIDRREKSHIVTVVRAFLGLSPITPEEIENVFRWLQDGLAKKQNDIAVLINAAIERFKERRVEIPPSDAIQSVAQRALNQAAATALDAIDKGLGADEGERLDTLLSGKEGKTLFDFLKNPVPQATVNNLAKELLRIERLGPFFRRRRFLRRITRHQQEQFAQLARRYTASELAQLSRARRRALLLCFTADRRAFLLDAAADMIIRIWESTKHGAGEYANIRQQAMASTYEFHQGTLSEILSIIDEAAPPRTLARRSPVQDAQDTMASWTACATLRVGMCHILAKSRSLFGLATFPSRLV